MDVANIVVVTIIRVTVVFVVVITSSPSSVVVPMCLIADSPSLRCHCHHGFVVGKNNMSLIRPRGTTLQSHSLQVAAIAASIAATAPAIAPASKLVVSRDLLLLVTTINLLQTGVWSASGVHETRKQCHAHKIKKMTDQSHHPLLSTSPKPCDTKDTTSSLNVTINRLSVSSSPFPSPGSPFFPPPVLSPHEYAVMSSTSKRRSTDSRMNAGNNIGNGHHDSAPHQNLPATPTVTAAGVAAGKPPSAATESQDRKSAAGDDKEDKGTDHCRGADMDVIVNLNGRGHNAASDDNEHTGNDDYEDNHSHDGDNDEDEDHDDSGSGDEDNRRGGGS
ncbi:hypothetical protein EDB84DRAFT_1580590 [Lactarius hengduanensis]|nr:hypothetical protein EDB84DRAFT_1580590 [Lactarius hengduanensis]